MEKAEFDEQYWDHLEEYEKTYVRHFFFLEMYLVQPEWVKAFKESGLKAIQYLDNEQGKTVQSLKEEFQRRNTMIRKDEKKRIG